LRVIQLFICRDSGSKQLLEDLKSLIEPLKGKVDLKVHLIHINKPEDFPGFLATMEELFGGISTLTFRKYGIRRIPAIVVDERKVLEGRYPSKEELFEILREEGITLEEALPLPPKPIVEMPTIREFERYTPPEKTPELPPRIEEELPPPREEFPSLREEEELIYEEQPAPLPVEEPESMVEEIKPVEERLRKNEVREAPPPPPTPKPEARKAKRTCTSCIFYNEITKRCAMLGKIVEDPSNPPCSW